MIRTPLSAALLFAATLSAPALAQDAGQAQYQSWCAACHRSSGLGVKGAFPPLAGSAVVEGDPAALAALVLGGRGGMPTFETDLTDAQIAAILTYVRAAWGNAGAPVSEAQVSAVRARPPMKPPEGQPPH